MDSNPASAPTAAERGVLVTAAVADVTCTSATAAVDLAAETVDSGAAAGPLAARLAVPVLEFPPPAAVFDAEVELLVSLLVLEPRAEDAVDDDFDGAFGPAVDESDFDVLLVLPLEPVESADATAGFEAIARPTPSATADAPAQQIRVE
jgi:hypothetical protein